MHRARQLVPGSIINPGGRRTSPLGRAALHNALRRLGAPTEHGHGVTPEKIRAAFLAGRFLSCVPPWLNVGHQMIADQHDRALEVIFSRIRENKEILGNLKIEGTTAR
jgi:hypothetical protein